ncbi:unnamed protein product [Heterosigma akashiwo]
MLYCRCCSTFLGLHKSGIHRHIIAKKHREAHTRWNDNKAKRQQTMQSIKAYQEETEVQGLTNCTEVEAIFKHDVVFSYCKSGDPINSVDAHHDLLVKYGYALPHSAHLKFNPLIVRNECQELLDEFKDRKVGVVFDGASWVGECLVVVFRAVRDDWTILQRVVKVNLLAKSMDNRHIKAELVECILGDMRKSFRDVIGFSYDRASANKKAITALLLDFNLSHGVPCIPHSFDRVGVNFKAPRARRFFGLLQSLLGLSPNARLLWELKLGFTWPDPSDTRWWSLYETYVYMLLHGEGIETFIIDGYDRDFLLGSENMKKLFTLVFLDNETELTDALEIVALVEGARPFVQACYFMEGDGLLILHAHDCIKWVQNVVQNAQYPCIDEWINKYALLDVPPAQQMAKRLEYKMFCINVLGKGYDYFNKVFIEPTGDVGKHLDMFKACRMLNPGFVKSHCHNPQTLQEHTRLLRHTLKFMDDVRLEGLLRELPEYIRLAED